MAPLTQTPEYLLLKALIDDVDVSYHKLNSIALNSAIVEGYAKREGDRVFITDKGYDRFDYLNDR